MLKPGLAISPNLTLIRRVGRGGQAEVWQARELSLGRDVAVKILPSSDPWGQPDATAQQLRAWREAKAVARLLHPAIAAVHRVGTFGEHPFLVMEWVDGTTLRERMASAAVDAVTAGQWLREIGHAVQHAHDQGVIHCDLKPENILVRTAHAGIGPIKLIDFGLARGFGLDHRSPVQIRGTAAYLPPEVGLAPPNAKGDQYALGVLATELLTGSAPTLRDDGRQLFAPGLPTATAEVLRRALASDPERRFPSVAAFVDELSATLPRAAVRNATPVKIGRLGPLSPSQFQALEAGIADRTVLALLGAGISAVQLTRAFGSHPIAAVMQRLSAAGMLDGDPPLPLVAEMAEDAARSLPEGVLRQTHVAVAMSMEQGDPSQPWVAEQATAAWARAGEPLHAARCLASLAGQTANAHRRSSLLRRAAEWSAAGSSPAAQYRACVQWGLAAVRCGLRREAEDALATALGAMPAAGLSTLTIEGWCLRASVRELCGDEQRAASAWETAAACDGNRVMKTHAQVGRARALLRADQPALAAALAAQEMAHEAESPSLEIAATLTSGVALERSGRTAQALTTLRIAAADALSLGDPLDAAKALVTLGEALRRSGQPDGAKLQVDEAEDVLRGQGVMAVTVSLAILQGRVALARDDAWQAWGAASRAATLAEQLALRPHEHAAWTLAEQCAQAAGLPGDAYRAQQRLVTLRRRAGRPKLTPDDWWLDGGI
ncbi:MAG: serine/threonine protein kinase [Myxococcales bacterium]|nr:serine/threonine protein kinase [Myxococcales bacterium]